MQLCREVLRLLNMPEGALSVVFVDAEKMRELNHKYRKRDYPTDVLSFEYKGTEIDGHVFLGEIVIAPEIAWRQHRRWRGRPDREIRKLLVHGILHLLGYNHETDGGAMNRIQQSLMRKMSRDPDLDSTLVEMRDAT